MAFEIVQTREGSVPSPVMEYYTAGAAAITKGELLTLVAGVLVVATGATKAQFIAKASALANATNVPVEVFEEGQIALVGYTGGTPTVGVAYDSDANGLLLNVADTTNPKLEVVEVFTALSMARVKNVARSTAEV